MMIEKVVLRKEKTIIIINLARACAGRIIVLIVCVCTCVCLSVCYRPIAGATGTRQAELKYLQKALDVGK